MKLGVVIMGNCFEMRKRGWRSSRLYWCILFVVQLVETFAKEISVCDMTCELMGLI